MGRMRELIDVNNAIRPELEERVSDIFGNRASAVAEYKELTGRNANWASRDVNMYCRNPVPYPSKSKGEQERIQGYLERLALFYQMLHIQEDSFVLNQTRKIYPAFQYPSQ
jgi:hypothetical protein